MLKICVTQTNLYYHQWVARVVLQDMPHQRPWKDLTVSELKVWIGILLHNALHPHPSISLYWSSDPNFASEIVKKTMSLVRFEQIKRFIHLADSGQQPKRGAANYDVLYKLRPWLAGLLTNSQEMFVPGKCVSVDEMDISFKGRSAFKSRVKFKRAGDGFLAYALCDPVTGYTYSYQFQFDNKVATTPGLSKTFSAVYQLMRQLPGDGYHVFVDNLYSSCLLAEKLLEDNKLYTCTARSDRIPDCVKQTVRRGQGAEEARGTVKWACRRNVVALTVYDNKPVPMITTGHHKLEDVVYTRKRTRINLDTGLPHTEDVELKKLNVIHDYNSNMNGVDMADQLRGYYSCSIKSLKWWHSILFWIIDTAVCNAYIIHREGMKGHATALPTQSHLQFVSSLATKLLQAECQAKERASSSGRKRRRSSDAVANRPAERLLGKHLIRSIQESTAATPQRDCVLCKEQGKRARSNYECGTCDVGLHPGCFEGWHQ
eukprot:scpid46239/ scgid14827/ PiggyBac transposable element-derived protein 4